MKESNWSKFPNMFESIKQFSIIYYGRSSYTYGRMSKNVITINDSELMDVILVLSIVW